MSTHNTRPLFSTGQLVITRSAYDRLTNDDILTALRRHLRGDWGNLCGEDIAANEQALTQGGRLFSAYYSDQGVKFWIITEADRSSTCVLLPEDY